MQNLQKLNILLYKLGIVSINANRLKKKEKALSHWKKHFVFLNFPTLVALPDGKSNYILMKMVIIKSELSDFH